MTTNNLSVKNTRFKLLKVLTIFFLLLNFSALVAQRTSNLDTVVSVQGQTTVLSVYRNGIPVEVIRLIANLKDGWQEVYYSNGKLKEKTFYRMGFVDGEKIFYDNYGNLLEIKTFKYDNQKGCEVLHGKYEKYQSSKLVQKSFYSDGLLDGHFYEYKNGILTIECTYKSGFLNGKMVKYNPRSKKVQVEEFYKIIDFNGKPLSVLHGKAIYYNYEGNIYETGKYEFGKREGEWVKYFNNSNTIERKQEYKNGLEHGAYSYYFPNGQLQKSGNAYKDIEVNGVKIAFALDGKNREFFANGQLKREEEYDMGSRKGTFVAYFENGQKQEYGQYKSNLKAGKWENWDTEGRLVRLVNYNIIKQNDTWVSVQDGVEQGFHNGMLSTEIAWKNGKKHGVQKTWFPNGNLATKMEFADGRIIGQYVEYCQNGNIKTIRNYGSIQRYDGTYSEETKETGWQIFYEENGEIRGKSWIDSYGTRLLGFFYKNGKNLQYDFNDGLTINYTPDGQLMSVIFTSKRHQPVLAIYYYLDGSLRKLAFQNAETFELNYAEFASDGQLINLYSNRHENPDSLRPSAQSASKYASFLNKNLSDNKLFSDLNKNGIYEFTYADGKPMARLSFKDELPNGQWLVFDALTGDTLISKWFENGSLKGPFVEKFAGKTVILRGEALSNRQNVFLEYYKTNGIPIEKTKFNEKGESIYKEEYYDNGQLKTIYDKIKGIERQYFDDGKISSENINFGDSSYQKSYYQSNNHLRTVYRYKSGKYHGFSEQYYESGQLYYRINYVEGKKEGHYVYFAENGELKSKGLYKDDKPEGQWIVTNNNRLDTVFYKEGKVVIEPPKYACACLDTLERLGRISFIPTLHGLVEFENLKTFLPPFLIVGDELNYDAIFYRNFFPSGGSRNYNAANLDLVMFDPFALRFPADEQFRLTFNPCKTYGYISSMPVSVSYNSVGLLQADFTTKMVKLEFLKGPIRSADPNHAYFSAYLATDEISYREGNELKFKQKSTETNCFTAGLIKSFLTVQPLSGHYLERNSRYFYTNLLKSEEMSVFYGIVADSSKLSFYLYSQRKAVKIEGNSDMLFLGGRYVAGIMSVPCTTDESGKIIFQTDSGSELFDIESIKLAWLQNGFSRVEVSFDKNTSLLKIKFFAE